MLPNSYEDAADILQYIPRNRGHHKWIFIDTDKLHIPPGTKTVSFHYGDWDEAQDTVVDKETANFSEDHVEVIGEEYIEWVRHPQWPENLFINRASLSSRPTAELERDNWLIRIYSYEEELYRIANFEDVNAGARTSVPSFAISPVDCQATLLLPWDVCGGFSFANPQSGQDQMIGIHNAESEIGASLARWIQFDSTMDYDHLREARTGMVYASNHPYGDLDSYQASYHHYARPGLPSIPYFRRPWWPMGVYRLAELYYTDDVDADGPAHVPVFNDEPTLEACAAYEATHSLESGQLVAEQYRRRYNLSIALSAGNGAQWQRHDHVADPHRWVYFKSSNIDIHDIGKHQGSINISTYGYEVASYATRVTVERGRGEFSDQPTLYRYERWPHHVWSTIWNTNGDGDKTPAYGPDAFGEAASYDDSTAETPVDNESHFSYQKWIRPTWDPAAVTTRGVGFMSVGFQSNGSYISTMRHAAQSYHVNNWTESLREFEATYFRRPSFPAGLWRRVDCFEDSCRGPMAVIKMVVLDHHDEPGGPDAPAPWYSAYLAAWVREIEGKIGRPISSSIDGTAPWLKFWTPEDPESSMGTSITVSVSGHHISLPVGELPRVRGHSRGTNIVDDTGDYHVARRYRSGIALAFNPCGVRYVTDAEDGEERPPPLKLLLDKIEEFYLDYHDPDVVEDLVDDMFERVRVKTDSFNEVLRREKANAASIQQQLIRSARQINKILEERSYYDSMTKGRFRKTLEIHRDQASNLGSLRIDGDNLILRMHQFDIEEQPIGPLSISIDISGRALPLFVTTEANASQHQNAHPHVDTDGRVCWGSGVNIAEQMSVGADPLEYIFWAANVLKEGYQPGDAYCPIHNWLRKEVWWCEHCDAEHPNGTNCPDWCSYCEYQQSDISEHNTCDAHGCWNDDDSNNGDCPTCEEDQEERDREEEEDAEAERLAEETERLEAEEERQRLAAQQEGQQENQQATDEESAAE